MQAVTKSASATLFALAVIWAMSGAAGADDETCTAAGGVPAASTAGYVTLIAIFVGAGVVFLSRRSRTAASSMTILAAVVAIAVTSAWVSPKSANAAPTCAVDLLEPQGVTIRRTENYVRVRAVVTGEAGETYKLVANFRRADGTYSPNPAVTIATNISPGGTGTGIIQVPSAADGATLSLRVRAIQEDDDTKGSHSARHDVVINEKSPDVHLQAGQVYEAGLAKLDVDAGFEILTADATPASVAEAEKWPNNQGIKITAQADPPEPKTATVKYTTQNTNTSSPGRIGFLKVTVYTEE